MCDKPRPRKKLDQAPAELKIVQRIKLEDNKKWVAAQKARNQQLPEEQSVEINLKENEIEGEEIEEDLGALEAFVESEQDRLVEEILRKRRINRNRSSFQFDNGEDETEPESDSQLKNAGAKSDDSDASSSSGNAALSQNLPKPKVSINSIIKDRILYHGLNKYPDDYDKNQYWAPVPKPKKRAPATVVNTSTDTPLSIDGTSKSSTLSSSASSDVVFGVVARSYNFKTEDEMQNEVSPAQKRALGSRISMMSAVMSKIELLPTAVEVESDERIAEQLVSLDAKLKKKKTLLRPVRTIPGYPKCIDTTEGFPECLPPGEIVRRSIRPDQLWGIPMNKPLSKEQFIDLMQQIENYPTNDYVCLSYMYPFKSREFNPYLFKIVQFKDVDPKEYFTLCKSGIMHFQNGMAEYTSILKFSKQIYLFERLRQVPFLMLYPMYKSFRIWRSNICQTRMKKNRKQLEEALFTTKRPLRGMLTLLFRMIEKISEMGFLSLATTSTYEVKDFAANQETRLEIILKRFQAFESMVMDLTENACRTYLVECGFSAEHYIGEVEFYLRGLTVPPDQLIDEVANFLDYPGQWLPYSLQAKKKRICARLSNFIHLIDFYVQDAYHRLLKTSVLRFMTELHVRTKLIPLELGGALKYIYTFVLLRSKNEALFGKLHLEGGHGPIFEIGCSYNEDTLTLAPPQDKFLKFIRSIFSIWKNGICTYKNLLPDDTFNPYTRPIVNGYMEEKKCGDGPNLEFHYNTDPDLSEVYDTIEIIIKHNYDACRQYVDTFELIMLFCLENDHFDVTTISQIEDANELMVLLQKYHKQLKQVEDIEDEKIIGIFHIDNGIFREKSLPSIMRIIDVLHAHVPKVARKFLEALTDRFDVAITTIEKSPETPDELVDFLVFLDEIQEQLDDIEREMDDCLELTDLIEIYKMTTTEEDIEGFALLVPLLSRLRKDIDTQVQNRETLIAELAPEIFEHNSEETTIETDDEVEKEPVLDLPLLPNDAEEAQGQTSEKPYID